MKWLGMTPLTIVAVWLMAGSADGQDKKLSDADVTKLLVGKWVEERNEPGNSGKIEMTLKKDGTYLVKGMVKQEKQDERVINKKGKWKVANGTLEMEPENRPASETYKGKIIEISDVAFKVKTPADIEEYKRVKE